MEQDKPAPASEGSRLAEAMFLPENLACPHELWAEVREKCPVLRLDMPGMSAPGFAITRRADLEFAAMHPEIYSSECNSDVQRWGNDFGPAFADILKEGYTPVHTIVSSDAPNALFYRKIVLEALSPKRIAVLKPALQGLIDELVADLPRDGSIVDFRPAFAIPLPMRAILDVYGLPREDADFVYWFTCECLQLFDPSTDLETARGNAKAMVKAQNYLAPKILHYREEPAENLLSSIANSRKPDGALLTMEETLSVALITLLGGNDTTRNALLIAARVLASDRKLWEALEADSSKIPTFVEEIVRTGAPAALTARQTKVDTTLGAVAIPAGSAIYMMWASGSRDETAIEAPDEIRLDRPHPERHASFGIGLHHCAGRHLALSELSLSVQTWLREFAAMELAETLDDAPFEPRWSIRSIERLPLRIRFRKP